MKNLKMTLLLGTAATLLTGMAAAQSPAPAKVTAATYKVEQVTENGKTVEKLVDASKGVLPTNILQFSQKLDNLSGKPLTGVRLALPIPGAVTYLSQQCNVGGVQATYSLDKNVVDPKTGSITNINTRKYGAAPLMKTVTVKENGVDVKKEVQAGPADYTAVRWNLPNLTAGQSVECSVRVKVK